MLGVTLADIAALMGWRDLLGLAVLILGALVIGWRIEHPGTKRPSVTLMMAEHRLAWMARFSERDNRIFDSQLLSNLRQSASFFTSTCLIAIGGVFALIGNVDPLTGIAEDLHAGGAPKLLWQIKLMLVALFLAVAFLRFVWATRVFGYCAILMGAVPNDPGAAEFAKQVRRAGELNIRAGINFNRGLRSMYYALAALAWLLGPMALIVAAVAVLWLVWSREFASVPRRILSQ